MESKTQFEDILKALGFIKESNWSWSYNFGNLKIDIHRYFDPFDIFHFYGNYITGRQAGEIEFKIPAEVDSYEQGVALMAYYFRNATFIIKPAWLKQGLEWKHHLPWEKEWAIQQAKEKERREYSVQVDYEWFKVLVKKLKQHYIKNPGNSLVEFYFDGEVLRVRCCEETEVLKGKGKRWKYSGVISISELSKLPNRIMRHHAEIILHNDKLYLCNNIFTNMGYQE